MTPDLKKLIRIISAVVALLGGGVGYEILTDDVPDGLPREEAPVERPSGRTERSVPKSETPKSETPKSETPKSETPKSVVVRPSSGKPEPAKGKVTKIVVKSSPAASESAKQAKPAERKRCVFASFRDGQWVTGWGTVKKILPDDTVPPCHQRFLLVDPAGETMLVANNIDRWQRLGDLHVGDVVEFKGEFKDTERGYLVHWTHPDTTGRRPGGYVRKAKQE